MRPSALPLKRLSLFALPLLLLGLSPSAGAQDKPLVYNDMEGDGGVAIDRLIKDAYQARYTIVDTTAAAGYTEPVPVAGEMPKSPATESGQLLGGYVLVVYLVSDQGLVAEPVVLRSSDPRLSDAALRAMAQWRFKPGKLKGVPIATTAAQEFNFGPVDVSNGYAMKRIGVYQARDVLLKRMPPSEAVSAYAGQVKEIARNFFVGVTTPQVLHVVVVTRPGGRLRVWLLSSARPGTSPDLARIFHEATFAGSTLMA